MFESSINHHVQDLIDQQLNVQVENLATPEVWELTINQLWGPTYTRLQTQTWNQVQRRLHSDMHCVSDLITG